MEAIVLAGGLGTRLRPLVSNAPKSMALINKKPFLEILLSNLSRNGFRTVILSLGFMSEKIIKHFGSRFNNLNIIYSVESFPLGTGGATRLAIDQIKSDHTFILNGDTFVDVDFTKANDQWIETRRPIVIVKNVPDASRYGCLKIEGKLVTSLIEKTVTGPGIINAGCYILGKRDLDIFKMNTAFSLEMDFLMPAVSEKRLDAFITQGHFIDIGIPEDYLRAQRELGNL